MGTAGYLLKEGYNNLSKHIGKTFSTIVIMIATMLVLGLFILAGINLDKNVSIVTSSVGFQAFISDSVLETDIAELENKIKGIANIKSIEYLDKEAAFEDAKDTLKDYAYLLNGLESTNPFPRSFLIVFNTLEDTEKVKEAVETVDGIYKVSYNNEIINAVSSAADIGMIVMLSLGTVMIIISLFILSNTIKLSVYSNKREVYIMKYMGATPRFIRTPFVISGILMGLASAITSWILISVAYILLYRNVPHFSEVTNTFGLVSYKNVWYIILGTFSLIGVLLGGIGSNIAVKKYQGEFKASSKALKEERQKQKEYKEKNKVEIENAKKAKKLKESEEKIKAKLKKEREKKEAKESKESKTASKDVNIETTTNSYDKEIGLDEAKKARKEVRRNVKK